MSHNLKNRMEKIQEAINVISTITKDIEEIKIKQTEMNSSITEIKNTLKKNTLEWTNSRLMETEERLSELENRMVGITAEEQNKGKRMKRIEDSLRDLLDNIKCISIWIIRVTEGEG